MVSQINYGKMRTFTARRFSDSDQKILNGHSDGTSDLDVLDTLGSGDQFRADYATNYNRVFSSRRVPFSTLLRFWQVRVILILFFLCSTSSPFFSLVGSIFILLLEN